MLEDPCLIKITEVEQNRKVCRLHFHQVGTTEHYVVSIRQSLDSRFPGRWIERRSMFAARSRDVSPLDFFFGDTLKIYILLRSWNL